jgi:hypothetical protein
VDLHQVRDDLDALMAGSVIDHAAMLRAVVSLADERSVGAVLDAVMQSAEHLSTTTAMSYDHPNQFSKIVLLSGSSVGWKLRLHIWWPDPETPATPEDIHNHRWDFASVLLLGGYCAEEFTAGSGDLKAEHYHYFSPEDGAAFRVHRQGPAVLDRTAVAQLAEGSAYTISHRQLHRVHADSSAPAASLMLQTPALTDHTSVYVDPGAAFAAAEIPVWRMSPRRVAEEIGRIRTYLAPGR